MRRNSCYIVSMSVPPADARSTSTSTFSSISCFGHRVSGFVFRVSGFGFRVPGFGFRVSGFGSRVSGFGFRVQGLGLTVSGVELSVFGLESGARFTAWRAKEELSGPEAKEVCDLV